METFTEITLAEMQEHLRESKGWVITDTNCNEYVFDYSVNSNPNVIIRVYSSIHKNSDTARGVGQDAIRTMALLKISDGPPIQVRGLVASLRTNRTTNWRINLKARIVEVIALALRRAKR